MPVQINEIIIRAIVTSDDKHAKAKTETTGKKKEDDHEDKKIEILELIDEALKNKKER